MSEPGSTPDASPARVPVVASERLDLRWPEAADAAFLFELMNDDGWLRHIGDRGIRSPADARQYIETRLRPQCLRLGYGLNSVELRASGELVGLCGLVRRDWLEEPDLGFAFLPRFRGRGLATEAALATLDHARTVLGLARVAAIVAPDNRASIELLERVGMRCEREVLPPAESQPLRLYARSL
jgi:RimJ/RimL family protein N-acetyltransferase